MGKSSTKTNTIYGNTTTKNPYVESHTDNSGTTSKFVTGTALQSIYDFVNKNTNSLLEEYLNPTLNSTTNQAKLNSFEKALSSNNHQTMENNIINPLSKRNMIRSSQATDLYKNLSDQNTNAISSYIDNLISESQNNTASMLNNLLTYYLNGYDVISNNQRQSLNTSAGNATHTQTNKSTAQLLNDIKSAGELGGKIGGNILKSFGKL